MALSATAQVNEDNIGADLFDVFVADNDIGAAFKQAAEMEALGYDDFMDLSGTFIEFHIYHISDLLTVSDIDDFFFLKTGK